MVGIRLKVAEFACQFRYDARHETGPTIAANCLNFLGDLVGVFTDA